MAFTVSTKNCYYHKNRGIFSAEASDLGLKFWPAMISLKSHKTGKTVSCINWGMESDSEGDLELVRYIPIAEGETPAPFKELIIFND